MKNELAILENFLETATGIFQNDSSIAFSWHEEKDRFLRALIKNVLQLPSQKKILYYVLW